MTKLEAIAIFGSGAKVGRAVGLSRSRISQWPEELDQKQSDLVRGAAVRLNMWPSRFPDRRKAKENSQAA